MAVTILAEVEIVAGATQLYGQQFKAPSAIEPAEAEGRSGQGNSNGRCGAITSPRHRRPELDRRSRNGTRGREADHTATQPGTSHL